MVWVLAAQAAFQMGQGYMAQQSNDKLLGAQRTLTRANTAATNLTNQVNGDAANSLRAANNAFTAAQATLQNTLRSLGNQEKMRVFGQQYNSLETNQARVLDGMVRGKLAARLRGAATLGALRADAAARGVGGTSSELMRSVLSLQTGAALTTAEDNEKYVQFDSLMQKQGLIRTAVNSQDQGQSLPNLDYGINIAPVVLNPINQLDYQSSAIARAGIGWLNGDGMGTVSKLLGSMGGTPSAKPSGLGTGSYVQTGAAVSQVDLGGGNYFTGA
ncbi:hypothetical protein [Achromobacter mucicolens]|uniref:hypothetical protein n=1 Tax=Achromobacter mucicolens TaxID=1389922 RepID=UPI002FE32BF2